MNSEENELRKVLGRLPPPRRDDAARDRALALALAELESRPQPRRAGRSWWPAVYGWGAALAACLVLMMVLLRPQETTELAEAPEAGTPASGDEVLSEMELLFPRQLDAVIREGGQVDLKLSEAATSASDDQPIRITFRYSGRVREVWTFSGRNICLDFNGKPLCFTPLLRGDGTVIVLTEDQVILPADPDAMKGFKISARALAS